MSLANPARLARVSGAFVVSGAVDVSVVVDGRLLAFCLGGERGHTEVEAVTLLVGADGAALSERRQLEARARNGMRLRVPENARMDDATLLTLSGQELPLRRWLDWRTQHLVGAGRAPLTLPPSLAAVRGLPAIGVQVPAVHFGSLRQAALDVGAPTLVRILRPPGGVSGGTLAFSAAGLDLNEGLEQRVAPPPVARGAPRVVTLGGQTWSLMISLSESRGPRGLTAQSVAHVAASLPVTADVALRYDVSEYADPSDPLGTLPRPLAALFEGTRAL